jgi:hypothetical protein
MHVRTSSGTQRKFYLLRIVITMDLQEHIQGLNVGEQDETLQFAVPATAPPQKQPAPRARAPTRRVDHTYRDYSRLPWDKQPVSGKTGSSKFPAKLHKILSNSEFSHVRLSCGHEMFVMLSCSCCQII